MNSSIHCERSAIHHNASERRLRPGTPSSSSAFWLFESGALRRHAELVLGVPGKTLLGIAIMLAFLFATLPIRAAETAQPPPPSSPPPHSLLDGFKTPPDSAKPRVYWSWIDNHISKPAITKDLEEMKKVGIGGALIFILSAKYQNGPTVFGTPEWYDAMNHAITEAGRLGLELTIYTGSGWAQGSVPALTADHSSQKLTWTDTYVKGPARIKKQLPQPAITRLNPEDLEPIPAKPYYRDVAVYAYRLPDADADAKPMRDMRPKITASAEKFDGAVLTDLDHETGVMLSGDGKNKAPWMQIEFPEPYSAQSLMMRMFKRPVDNKFRCTLQVSTDGKNFTHAANLVFPINGPFPSMATSSFNRVTGRFFRFEFDRIDHIGVADIELYPTARIPDWNMKAGNLRLAVRLQNEWTLPEGQAVALKDIVDLSGKMSADGTLDWDAPEGSWMIVRLGQTSAGTICDPAPEGGAGLNVDALSKEAVEDLWGKFTGKIAATAGPLAGKALKGVHTDSWEAGTQNWTIKFREDFRARRGYDPMPYLPAMLGVPVESAEVSEKFLRDVRQTINDLFAENYYGHLRTLAHRQGMTLSCEPYGGSANFNDFQCGSHSDMPMATFWTHTPVGLYRKDSRGGKFSASIATTHGSKLVGAEVFTTRPSEKHGGWRDHPYGLKTLGDINAFANGVNRMFIHGFAHQPWLNAAPGMTLGRVGTHLDWRVTWWNQGRAWMDYLSRCQWMLQQGLHVADAIALIGEDPAKALQKPQLPDGYDWDICDDEIILKRMSVKNGRITLPDGMSYRYLELPDLQTMTPEVMRKIKDLVAAGATVVGPKPAKSPSLSGYPVCDDEVRKLADEVWGRCNGKSVTENRHGKGRVIWGKTWKDILAADNLPPDFRYVAKNKKAEIYSIHRNADGQDIYFLANAGDSAEETVFTFRVSGKVPEFWHPDTGEVKQAAIWREKDGMTEVLVPFDPRGSTFVVFKPGKSDSVTSLVQNGENIFPELAGNMSGETRWEKSGAVLTAFQPTEYALEFASGKKIATKISGAFAPIEITGAWNVTFPPKLGAPKSATFDTLISWPEHKDAGIKYFSGVATYTKEIEIPAEMIAKDNALVLDLGRVEVIAEVSVNGKDLGVLWKPPFRVDIGAAAKPGKNQLVIKVVNLWPNRIIGDEKSFPSSDRKSKMPDQWPDWVLKNKPRPENGRVTFATWKHWKATDKLLDSGLLGPVRLECGISKTLE